MTNGTITGNKTNGMGGGVATAVLSKDDTVGGGLFHMTGGTISDNTASCGGAHCIPRRPDEADPLMADWKKNRQKFQMPHDRVERCMRYVKAVEKDEKRAEKARKARFDALLLERWQARQANREKGNAEI